MGLGFWHPMGLGGTRLGLGVGGSSLGLGGGLGLGLGCTRLGLEQQLRHLI